MSVCARALRHWSLWRRSTPRMSRQLKLLLLFFFFLTELNHSLAVSSLLIRRYLSRAQTQTERKCARAVGRATTRAALRWQHALGARLDTTTVVCAAQRHQSMRRLASRLSDLCVADCVVVCRILAQRAARRRQRRRRQVEAKRRVASAWRTSTRDRRRRRTTGEASQQQLESLVDKVAALIGQKSCVVFKSIDAKVRQSQCFQ